MISNYYVLAALAREWRPRLVGSKVVDAYSQSADELSLEFEFAVGGAGKDGAAADGASESESAANEVDRSGRNRRLESLTLRVSMSAPLRYLLLTPGSGRARRNVADVLSSAVGCRVSDVRILPGDRILDIVTSDNPSRAIRIVLYGAGANAYVVSNDGVVLDSFRSTGAEAGERVTAHASEGPANALEFSNAWANASADGRACGQVLAEVLPLFNRFMADEVIARAGIARNVAGRTLTNVQIESLYERSADLRRHFDDGFAWIYWNGSKPERLSLFESVQMSEFTPEHFGSVSEATSVFVRRSLSWKTLSAERDPVLRKVSTELKRTQRRLDGLEKEVASAERADDYERFGHILMAQPPVAGPLDDPFTAIDSFSGEPVQIRIDRRMSLIENANRYYDKARTARAAREAAEERLETTRAAVHRLVELHDRLDAVDSMDHWKSVQRELADALAPYGDRGGRIEPEVPFRQFDLGSGYVVWVGRNAKQNELLSTRAARKFDLWFHARGVPGSHVVLRLPHNNITPDQAIVEQAARIAAHYSKARGSGLAPVIVAEAKFVRKPRGAAPGTVTVERERVLLVEPGLPE